MKNFELLILVANLSDENEQRKAIVMTTATNQLAIHVVVFAIEPLKELGCSHNINTIDSTSKDDILYNNLQRILDQTVVISLEEAATSLIRFELVK